MHTHLHLYKFIFFQNKNILASAVSTVTLPPFGQLAAEEQRLEGRFRAAHSELITNCEQVLFVYMYVCVYSKFIHNCIFIYVYAFSYIYTFVNRYCVYICVYVYIVNLFIFVYIYMYLYI